MRGTISVVFTLHTLLCAAYVAYLASTLSRWAADRQAHQPGLEAVMGSDERMTSAAAHATLLLYLSYAEVYLYNTWALWP